MTVSSPQAQPMEVERKPSTSTDQLITKDVSSPQLMSPQPSEAKQEQDTTTPEVLSSPKPSSTKPGLKLVVKMKEQVLVSKDLNSK